MKISELQGLVVENNYSTSSFMIELMFVVEKEIYIIRKNKAKLKHNAVAKQIVCFSSLYYAIRTID